MNNNSAVPPSIIQVVLGCTLIPAAAYAIGIDLVHSLLIASAVAGGMTVLRMLSIGEDSFWPQLNGRGREGNRREVLRLSWTLKSKVSSSNHRVVIQRLHALATRRLAELGIDFNDPADQGRASDVLGATAYQVLTGAKLSPRSMVRCVDVLEALQTERNPR
jgi:hypothetical protein